MFLMSPSVLKVLVWKWKYAKYGRKYENSLTLDVTFEKQFSMEDLSTDLPPPSQKKNQTNHEEPLVDNLFHLFLSSYLFTHLHPPMSSACLGQGNIT